MGLFNKKSQKQNILDKIDKISKEMETNPDNPSLLFTRATLYLKIQQPESALNDFILASKADKKYIKKSKYLCGKYHPILGEKFMSAVFYVIDPRPVKPFVRHKPDEQTKGDNN